MRWSMGDLNIPKTTRADYTRNTEGPTNSIFSQDRNKSDKFFLDGSKSTNVKLFHNRIK